MQHPLFNQISVLADSIGSQQWNVWQAAVKTNKQCIQDI